MPIVSYIVSASPTDPAGGRNATITYFDNAANVYTEVAYAPAGFDLEAKAAARMSELSEQLAASEAANVLGL